MVDDGECRSYGLVVVLLPQLHPQPYKYQGWQTPRPYGGESRNLSRRCLLLFLLTTTFTSTSTGTSTSTDPATATSTSTAAATAYCWILTPLSLARSLALSLSVSLFSYHRLGGLGHDCMLSAACSGCVECEIFPWPWVEAIASKGREGSVLCDRL